MKTRPPTARQRWLEWLRVQHEWDTRVPCPDCWAPEGEPCRLELLEGRRVVHFGRRANRILRFGPRPWEKAEETAGGSVGRPPDGDRVRTESAAAPGAVSGPPEGPPKGEGGAL